MLKHLFDNRIEAAPAPARMQAPLPIRQGFMTIQPLLADRFLKEATFEGQRRTDPIYVARHVENLKRGLWLDGSQIAFAKMGDKYFLINGKHRLTAIVAFGKPAEFSIVVYECANMDEVRSLYARFDNVQRARSSNQILAASDLPGQMGLSVGLTNAVYAATPLLLNGLKSIYHNDPTTARLRIDLGLDDFRISAALAWKEQAKIYERCISPAEGAIRRKLLNANVVAPALFTLKHARPRAEEFWSGIARNDGLRRGDPRHAFVQHILSVDMKSIGSGSGTYAVALAWNAWWDERKMTQVRPTSLSKLVFAGTPMNGRGR